MKDFKYIELIEQIKQDFKIDYYGDHFDSDRLDIGRVGYVVDPAYLATEYAKSLIK